MPDTAVNPIDAWIAANAAAAPDKPYIDSVEEDAIVSFRELADLAARLGRFLAARDIGANDRVVLLSHNSIEHLIVYLGVMARGATICTVHVEMNAIHLPAILASLGPKLILAGDGIDWDRSGLESGAGILPLGTWRRDTATGLFAELAAMAPGSKLAPVNGADDDASIFYTSGTSSTPKGVIYTFRDLCANAVATATAFGIGADDRVLDFRSFNWMSAQVLSALGTLCRGATLILARRFSRSRYFDWIRDHKATVAACNPTAIAILNNQPVAVTAADVPDLRFVTSSSAPLLIGDWKKFEERYGIPVAQGYGSSETGWIAGCDETTRRFGTVGKPLPYQNVRIVDDDGTPLAPGEVGKVELGARDGIAFRSIAADGTVSVDSVGRTRTGDLGFIDPDGYLHLTGREKDLIIRGGVNIAPVEIDNVVLEVAGIAEAAAVGVPDGTYGEEIVVYVSAGTGSPVTESEIRAHCSTRLAAFKQPREIIFRPSLPKTERGKLDRNALRLEWQARHG